MYFLHFSFYSISRIFMLNILDSLYILTVQTIKMELYGKARERECVQSNWIYRLPQWSRSDRKIRSRNRGGKCLSCNGEISSETAFNLVIIGGVRRYGRLDVDLLSVDWCMYSASIFFTFKHLKLPVRYIFASLMQPKSLLYYEVWHNAITPRLQARKRNENINTRDN